MSEWDLVQLRLFSFASSEVKYEKIRMKMFRNFIKLSIAQMKGFEAKVRIFGNNVAGHPYERASIFLWGNKSSTSSLYRIVRNKWSTSRNMKLNNTLSRVFLHTHGPLVFKMIRVGDKTSFSFFAHEPYENSGPTKGQPSGRRRCFGRDKTKRNRIQILRYRLRL